MKKIIRNNTVYFCDDNGSEIMYFDFSTDECIWYFCSNDLIKITQEMELYDMLNKFMKQDYIFSDEILKNYKNNNKLIWYSDCSYNPDDQWSVESVSCLNIERKDDCFNIWCTKKLDEKINNPHKSYCICFSPAGNGKYSRNLNTDTTLQDDFIVFVYQELLFKSKNRILKKTNN